MKIALKCGEIWQIYTQMDRHMHYFSFLFVSILHLVAGLLQGAGE